MALVSADTGSVGHGSVGHEVQCPFTFLEFVITDRDALGVCGAALEELRPDIVVMEGPADAEESLALASHAEMRPPVALLVYPPEQPRRAVYFPLTVFSPEWQTLQWAQHNRVPLRLMDLPQSHQLAMSAEGEKSGMESEPGTNGDGSAAESAGTADAAIDLAPVEPGSPEGPTWRSDPLALLAEASGYRDHELWWEEQIERRRDATDLFVAILEAMRCVREELPEGRERDLLREAFMRKTLRDTAKEGHEKIAVVCGAWHAPVLDEEAVEGKRPGCTIKEDNDRLKGLPKLKTTSTWIPWTYSRMSFESGYGAGVTSPGWYDHLWTAGDGAPSRWLTTAARLLRDKDLDASSASVIEAVRLADALAALRELRAPGLTELNEAILTVLCHGEATRMQIIRRRLDVGDVLGEVPAETPAVPLAQDLARLQKSLRLKPSTEIKPFDLDVRKEMDLERSHLFHRLTLLGIPWGMYQSSGGRTSTFHEIWNVEWKPEFVVAIIEANVWGNTVEFASTAKVLHDAAEVPELSGVTALLDSTILAGLGDAVDPLLSRIQAMAAVGADVRHLMEALLPLARVARYGDVRGTRADHVEPILVGMFQRAVVGLGAACSALDDEAAERMLTAIGQTSQALDLLNRDDLQSEWLQTLEALMNSNVHALLRGWCCRLLLEKRHLSDDELYRQARLSLSPANPPAECASWATGLLRGSGLLLLHQDAVWQVFDRWLSELTAETFVEMLPLLRRAFADFSGPERRQMGEKVKTLASRAAKQTRQQAKVQTEDDSIDHVRAAKVLPILAHILGVSFNESKNVDG